MNDERHFILRAAAKLSLPAAFLFSLHLTFVSEIGGGLAGGAAAALAIAVHALMFGPAATKVAFPPLLLRICTALGALVVTGAALGDWMGLAAHSAVVELGVFLIGGGGLGAAFLALGGRTHELRAED
ncbi:MAG: MnhB domain-containing protein [Hyphomonadaceae bacterium]